MSKKSPPPFKITKHGKRPLRAGRPLALHVGDDTEHLRSAAAYCEGHNLFPLLLTDPQGKEFGRATNKQEAYNVMFGPWLAGQRTFRALPEPR